MEIDSEQSYSAILKYLRLFTVAIGFDVFRTNYRPGLVTFLMYMDIVAFVGCMLYTVYQNRADAIEMLKAFYVIGVPIQGFIKSSTLVYYSRDIYAMNAQVLRLHRTTRGAWRRCLYEWTRRTDVVLKLQLFLYTITGFFFMTAPLFYYAMYGKRVLNMTMEAPGVDASTATGFVVMMAFEVYSVFLAVCIIFSVDGVFIIMCFVACAYEEMVRLKYEELADFLERTDVYDDRAVGEMLRSVIVADLQAEGFINRIRMYFEKGCAVQMYTGGLSLAFSIIVARTTDVFIAYPMCFTFLYIIMAYAAIGTMIQLQSEQLHATVSQMKWYQLAQKHRRMYLFMLKRSQRIVYITVFGNIKLNIETGMAILKSIYTAYMMLESSL